MSGDRVALEIESLAETKLGGDNNRYCFVMTVREGSIVRINEYVDTRYAAEALVPLIRRESTSETADREGGDGATTR